ncbi:HD domain-containing protein [Isachenkonia alkalipeptolytica]|uniref:bis(5'-nucleosyl)-tetraphosphatase (symmetrical) n=2 Tax=Isachenkonia alkalipeptolytica TaxID=2565777 RepID=A0AA43XM84_9CLOT|nr:HD domain-containing protein [Isachenkonia alkalipeptolytica]
MIERIKSRLKKRQPYGRYQHTLGVVKAACDLAEHYGISVDKARLAALLHDYAKDLTEHELKKYIEVHKLEVDQSLYETYELLHGVVGAHMAKTEFGIHDEEILQAIRYHTTGRLHMEPLEKIIYLSDFIEENRNYPGVEALRKLAYEDLDKGLLQGFNNTIRFLLATDKVIHCNTVKARNQRLKDLAKK